MRILLVIFLSTIPVLSAFSQSEISEHVSPDSLIEFKLTEYHKDYDWLEKTYTYTETVSIGPHPYGTWKGTDLEVKIPDSLKRARIKKAWVRQTGGAAGGHTKIPKPKYSNDKRKVSWHVQSQVHDKWIPFVGHIEVEVQGLVEKQRTLPLYDADENEYNSEIPSGVFMSRLSNEFQSLNLTLHFPDDRTEILTPSRNKVPGAEIWLGVDSQIKQLILKVESD